MSMAETTIHIQDAIANDAQEMINLLEQSWIGTYANENLGITEEDIRLSIFQNKDRLEEKDFPNYIEQQNSNETYHYWTAKCGDKLIGLCLVNKSPRHEISQLFIKKEYQGKGIGKQLLKKAFSWLGDNSDIYLTVVTYNKASIDWWKKYGFVETGNEPAELVLTLPSGKTIPEIEMVKRTLNH